MKRIFLIFLIIVALFVFISCSQSDSNENFEDDVTAKNLTSDIKDEMLDPICGENGYCCSNSDCASGEFCDDTKCVELTCGSCQFVKNGECVNYECCFDADCDDKKSNTNDECIKNKCVYELVDLCVDDDGVCAEGCYPSTSHIKEELSDSDCVKECDFFRDCDDEDPSTKNKCTAGKCEFPKIVNCYNDDNYCPNGCNVSSDSDCFELDPKDICFEYCSFENFNQNMYEEVTRDEATQIFYDGGPSVYAYDEEYLYVVDQFDDFYTSGTFTRMVTFVNEEFSTVMCYEFKAQRGIACPKAVYEIKQS
ncbi:hypothetical protein K9L97_05930 [Candidatus Woesearchaeota archaeon]|nr:hypothetical protein [Candidatus Woesearchaeota archaeon]